MTEKLKNKLNELKKDKSSYNEYIKCFCDSEKANELFKINQEFKKLKNLVSEKKDY